MLSWEPRAYASMHSACAAYSAPRFRHLSAISVASSLSTASHSPSLASTSTRLAAGITGDMQQRRLLGNTTVQLAVVGVAHGHRPAPTSADSLHKYLSFAACTTNSNQSAPAHLP